MSSSGFPVSLLVPSGVRVEPFLSLLDMPKGNTEVLQMEEGQIVFSKRIFIPIKPTCNMPSPSLWAYFRDFYFYESSFGDLVKASVELPSLKILLVNPKDKDFPDLASALQKKLKAEVTTITESASFLNLAKSFAAHNFIVGFHSRSLAHLVFAPKNSALLELFLEGEGGSPDLEMGQLARALEIPYTAFVTPGSSWDDVQLDLKKISAKAAALYKRMVE